MRFPLKHSLKTDEIYGNLTVISYTDRLNKKGEYKCKCICGKIVYARTYRLKNNNTTSCGCIANINMASKNRLPNFRGLTNEIYRQYKKSAKLRNYVFDLSIEEFEILIQSNCYYCNSLPLKGFNFSRKRKINNNDDFKYNGVDRINNNLGYIKNNCVSSCYICNNAKNILDLNDFLNWVKKLYLYQTELNNL